MIPKLKLGVAGLGRAFSLMAADLRRATRAWSSSPARTRAPRRARASKPSSARKPSIPLKSLCARPGVEVVYVATPHQFHAAARPRRGRLQETRPGRKADGAHAGRLPRHDCCGAQGGRAAHRRATATASTRRSCKAREIVASRRARARAHDQRAQLHRFPLPAAASGGARHRRGRRRGVQPGGAPGGHRAAARRQPGQDACAR